MTTPETFSGLARCFGVSLRTIENWRQYDDWPNRNKNGSFDLKKIDIFCKRHSIGPHNPSRGEGLNSRSGEYVRAKTQKTIEQAENERIKKERQLVEQAHELQDIVLVSDVKRLNVQTAAIVSGVIVDLIAAVDKAMPEAKPTDKEWAAIREKVIKLAGGIGKKVANAMQKVAKE